MSYYTCLATCQHHVDPASCPTNIHVANCALLVQCVHLLLLLVRPEDMAAHDIRAGEGSLVLMPKFGAMQDRGCLI